MNDLFAEALAWLLILVISALLAIGAVKLGWAIADWMDRHGY